MGAQVTDIMPDEGTLLLRLQLNATDAARVAGVTVRQLTYWTDKGIVPSRRSSGRSYDMGALRKAMSIKRLMLEGYTLEKAAQVLEDLQRQGADDQGLAAGPGDVSAYFDGLVAGMSNCKQKLPAYLAIARLKAAADKLASVDLDRLLNGESNREEIAWRIAARLDAAAREIDHARDELAQAPVVSNGGAERVGALF